MRKIWIVDDESNIGLSLRLILEREGFAIQTFTSASDYRRGLEIFREKLTDKFINEYAQKAKDRGLFVDIKFEYDDTKLIVEVLNNSALTKREDERIRDKFPTSAIAVLSVPVPWTELDDSVATLLEFHVPR